MNAKFHSNDEATNFKNVRESAFSAGHVFEVSIQSLDGATTEYEWHSNESEAESAGERLIDEARKWCASQRVSTEDWTMTITKLAADEDGDLDDAASEIVTSKSGN